MDALQFLYTIWGEQAKAVQTGPAFAFVSLRSSPTSWRDFAYQFGADEIELPDSSLGDIYFCPNLFSRPRRRKELCLPTCWLYADLDTVEPIDNDAELSPTIAWESSPGRYQAAWHIDRHLEPHMHEILNRKLTYALGADRGGWDLTQVLRVPGTVNHKYDAKPEVTLLWA
jgi:RepB DNA-primase from phage plasmid